jgi:hypothetical protein
VRGPRSQLSWPATAPLSSCSTRAGSGDLGNRAVGLDWFPQGDRVAAFGQSLIAVSPTVEGGDVFHEPDDLIFGTSVSPDSSRIAFNCAVDQGWDICVVPTVTFSEATNATVSDEDEYMVGWLDDERILFISEDYPGGQVTVYEGHDPLVGSYFVLNVNDGSVVPASDADVGDPLLSPEGLWRFEAEVSADGTPNVRLEDGGVIPIPVGALDLAGVDPAFIGEQFDIAWSNGDVWAAVVQRLEAGASEGGNARSFYRVWLVDLNRLTVELILETELCQTALDCVLEADWSPDSQYLALLFGAAGD